MARTVLTVRELTLGYQISGGRTVMILNALSLDLDRGKILGLAGESGSGKSTLALASVGWRASNSVLLAGRVVFDGIDLLRASRSVLRRYWGARLAYVPQEVASALNPARRVGAQLEEPLLLHTGMSRPERHRRVEELLKSVQIDSDRESLSRYPFEFSGGQQQRIALALAMLCRPDVLVLDEPTSGIDATLKIEVLRVLRELLDGEKTAAIYISHDLAETSAIADDLAIMYAGEFVERGPARMVYDFPKHPYSAALRAAVPSVEDETMVRGIPGQPPGRIVEDRCSFADRCNFVEEICQRSAVPLIAISEDHEVRCVRVGEIAIETRASRGAELVQRAEASQPPCLAIQDLWCVYKTGGVAKEAIADVSLTVRHNETMGIVGESGSGKSTLLRAIAGLHPPLSGMMVFEGRSLSSKARERGIEQHRAIQLVFQSPERSLNPRHSVARILEGPLRLFRPDIPPRQRRAASAELLERVQLPASMLARYPHQLSGGEKQRIALARAFASGPRLLLCDEVVSALDVSVQAGVMNLIRSYSAETGASVLFVTHDLAVVRMMSDRILVLRNGRVCEVAETNELFLRPSHPYSVDLLASLPGRPTAIGSLEVDVAPPTQSS